MNPDASHPPRHRYMQRVGASSLFEFLGYLRRHPQGAMLEDLGIAHAHVHAFRRLLDRAGLKESELENATIAIREGDQQLDCSIWGIARWLRTRRLGQVRRIGFRVDRSNRKPETATPMGSKDSLCGSEQVGTPFPFGDPKPKGSTAGPKTV